MAFSDKPNSPSLSEAIRNARANLGRGSSTHGKIAAAESAAVTPKPRITQAAPKPKPKPAAPAYKPPQSGVDARNAEIDAASAADDAELKRRGLR